MTKNILFLAIPALCGFLLGPLAGEANVSLCDQPKDTTIRAQDLKAYEGYYKMGDSYLHITATDGGLTLKQMWDNQEIAFSSQTALDFSNDDGNFPLKFTKAPDGKITEVLAFNRDRWAKVNEYKPVEVKEVSLKPSELKALEGKYTMLNDNGEHFYLQISATAKGLVLKQEWDGQEFPFVPLSDVDFYCKERQFPLKFTRDKDGNATEVLAFKRDVWKKVKG